MQVLTCFPIVLIIDKHLRSLLEVLSEVFCKWFEFGVELQIEGSELEVYIR